VAGLAVFSSSSSTSFLFSSSDEVRQAGSHWSGSGLKWYRGSVRRRFLPHRTSSNGTSGTDSRKRSRIEAASRSLSVKGSGEDCVAMPEREGERIREAMSSGVRKKEGRKQRGRDGGQ
jgi:hypothetical protein